MVYTNEVKKELDAILKAFKNYIEEQNYFDIVYSKKIGYVWIVVDEPGAAGAEQLDTPEAMLDNLFNDIINDVVAPRETTSLTEAHGLTESEEAECRRRITAILERIEVSGAEYLGIPGQVYPELPASLSGNSEYGGRNYAKCDLNLQEIIFKSSRSCSVILD